MPLGACPRRTIAIAWELAAVLAQPAAKKCVEECELPTRLDNQASHSLTEAMSDDESGTGDKPISATEEFRRAWRNSLLWSLLAIAVGFGSTDAGVAVSLLGTGLAFNQRLVASGALVIAGFMFLVYLRAKSNDRRLNAQSAVEASSASLNDIIQLTVRDAEAARGSIGSAKSTAEYIEHHLETEITRYKSELLDPKNRNTAISELQQLSIPYKPPLMGPSNIDPNDLKRELYTRLTNRIEQLKLEEQQRIEGSLEKADSVFLKVAARNTELLSGVAAQVATFDEATKRIGSSADSLTKFYKGISRRELRWYAALDVWAVYLMLGAALLVAGSRTMGYSPDRIVGIAAPLRPSTLSPNR